MRILKANTAVRLVVGPLCDKTTGLAKTGMTVTNMAMNMWHEHDDGSAPTKSIDAVSFTASGGNNDMVELAGGYYDIEITAAQTNITAGRASFLIYDDDVILPYFEEWLIVPANVFDSLMGTDKLDVNAAELGGTVQTGNDVGADVNDILADTGTDGVLLSSGTGAKQISLDAGKVLLQATQTGVTIPTVTNLTNLPSIPNDWLTGAGMHVSAGAEIADMVWDEAKSGHSSAGSMAVLMDSTNTYAQSICGVVDTEIAAILADTNELQTDLVNGGRLDLLIDGIKAKTDNLPADPADDSDIDSQLAAIKSVVDDVLVDTGTTLDTLVKDIPTNAELATALGAADDAVLAAVAAVKAETALIVEDTGTTLPAAILIGSAGSGSSANTYTVTSGGLPLSGAHVWATTDLAGANVVASGYTNDSGTVTFFLDSGTTYYIWKQKQGYNFSNPDTEVAT